MPHSKAYPRHRLLAKDKPVTLVAEIGVNHEGSVEKAKELIRLACEAGADAVKFQTYTPELYIASEDPERLARVKRFCLSDADFRQLADYAAHLGILFFSTAVTPDKIALLAHLAPVIKIASGDITELELIKEAAKSGADLVISTGAASLYEIEQAVEIVCSVIPKEDIAHRLALLHCVAAYPVPPAQAALGLLPKLQSHFSPIPVGYSNHVPAREAILTAVALGARIVEVHFTDQKHGRDFRDHALSMDSDDLAYLSQQLPLVYEMSASHTSDPLKARPMMACEQETQKSLRKGLVATRNLKKGHELTAIDIGFARPLDAFSTAEKPMLIGKTLSKDIAAGFHFKRKDLTS